MNHVVLVPERAFNQQKLDARDHQPVSVVEIGCDKDIGDPVSSSIEVQRTFRIPEWLAPEVPGGPRN